MWQQPNKYVLQLLGERKVVSKIEREELNILANIMCETWGMLQKKVRRYESSTMERDRDMSEVFWSIYPISSTLYLLEMQIAGFKIFLCCKMHHNPFVK